MSGWIKLHRKIKDKAFYCKDSEKVHLWIHLLLKANHSDREEIFNGKPILCKAGQFTTGRKQLSNETGINESKIQRILNYFEKIEHQIEQQTSSVNRLISVNNWDCYQLTEHQNEQQVNNDRTTSEQQVNTLEELKNKKNEIYNKVYFDDKELNSLFIDHLKLRDQIKAKNTERGINGLINELRRLTSDKSEAIRIIENSIVNNWKSYFPLKN